MLRSAGEMKSFLFQSEEDVGSKTIFFLLLMNMMKEAYVGESMGGDGSTVELLHIPMYGEFSSSLLHNLSLLAMCDHVKEA